MTQEQKDQIKTSIATFRLPRYEEIPNVGLYLEQMVKYINEFVAPLGDVSITSNMVSNYVKNKLIANPERKQYSRDQIAQLFMITIAKTVISLENTCHILPHGEDAGKRYDFFAAEFTNLLFYVFDIKDVIDSHLPDGDEQGEIIRNMILTAANKLYLDKCFAIYNASTDQE